MAAAPSLAAQAAQAAAEGQSLYNSDVANANNYKSQYNNYVDAANAAQGNVQNYSQEMQGDYNPNTGTGNAGSTYNYELGTQENELGYDPNQMAAATGNLNQATGALSAYSDFANTAASKFGQNAGGFAAANSGALSNLNNNIASNQNIVTGMQNKFNAAQTGANQFTGNVIQGENTTLGALQDVFTNASNQRDQAAQMMQFYSQLASTQGGLNSQEQASYASAAAAYAQAQQAIAQSKLLQQQFQHQQDLYNDQASQAAASNAAANGMELSTSSANRALSQALNSGQKTIAYQGVSF